MPSRMPMYSISGVTMPSLAYFICVGALPAFARSGLRVSPGNGCATFLPRSGTP